MLDLTSPSLHSHFHFRCAYMRNVYRKLNKTKNVSYSEKKSVFLITNSIKDTYRAQGMDSRNVFYVSTFWQKKYR